MLAEGYAPVQVKKLLHTTYSRIRRYATGDPLKLCRFESERASEASRYKNAIVELLAKNTPLKQALEHISSLGYKGKRTAFEIYCRKLVAEHNIPYTPKRNMTGVTLDPDLKKPKLRYVSKKDLLKHLWSGKQLESYDIGYITSSYPNILEIKQCILDFRRIYADKDVNLMEQFITRYSGSQIAPLKTFASGLLGDIDAVKNSVTQELSNGFVEGNNNKIKVIKRMMYGRAKIDLLKIKVLYAR